MRARRLLLLAALLSGLLIAPGGRAGAQSRIYWTETGQIASANLDGTDVVVHLDTTSVGSVDPADLELDPAGGKLYWMEFGVVRPVCGPGQGVGPYRAGLDGSDPELLHASARDCAGESVALDRVAGELTWGSGESVHRTALDGSADAVVSMSGIGDCTDMSLGDVDVDETDGRLYVADARLLRICRANPDLSGAELIFLNAFLPRGITLDSAAGKLYIAGTREFTPVPGGQMSGVVYRANLDGSELEPLIEGLDFPWGIALDVEGGKLYWADMFAGRIQRADLDGANVEDVVTGLASPQGLALLFESDEPPQPPECNSPATIAPPDAPVSFVASSADPRVEVSVTEFDCFKLTKKGKRVDKTGSCAVRSEGAALHIDDSGGVGDRITWTARATSAGGATAEASCALEVVRPARRVAAR